MRGAYDHVAFAARVRELKVENGCLYFPDIMYFFGKQERIEAF